MFPSQTFKGPARFARAIASSDAAPPQPITSKRVELPFRKSVLERRPVDGGCGGATALHSERIVMLPLRASNFGTFLQ
jgi:hypothetical protein